MTNNISKEKFLETYYNYPPNRWIIFIYSFFTKNNMNKELKLKNVYTFIFIILFLIGFFGVIFNLNKKIILCSIFVYLILLIIFIVSLTIAILMNNYRIKKICKELNINTDEYNKLSKNYFK